MSERIYEKTNSGKIIPKEEIVRCANCEYRNDNYCLKVDSLTEDTFFCGWGRKDNE